MKKILFTGGGSAGHVVPNLALIYDLQKNGGVKIVYLGTDGIEKRLVSGAGIFFRRISCPKLVRSFTPKNLAIPFSLFKAVRYARKILREENPDLVFSKGGYVSLPVCLAAAKEKIPVLTHESDLSPGLATKLIAKKCRRVLTSFPETAKKFRNGTFTGSPLRAELFRYTDKTDARKKFPSLRGKPTVLIFGGGSGAAAINNAVYACLDELLKRYDVLHIVGKNNAETAPEKAGYAAFGYVEDMGAAYACADLVVARAGSNTLFELAALKIPSLIVPLCRGSRGDQEENAAYFQKRGLVRILNEKRLPYDLLPQIDSAFSDTSMRAALKNSPFSKNGNEAILSAMSDALAKGRT
ncbi:MAG: UDP-N-acetylglucosamine--N-acetylmuramyl-(pentapeptide) pyrophosphoryl-undecaprenol N-acetylglucosamine transferase [Candidatus Scatosoma sp.]